MPFNPYQGGIWQPSAQQYYNQYAPQYSQGQMPQQTYNGTWSHLQNGGKTNVIRVAGPESAKAYPMGPGDVMVMFDDSNAVFYFVTADDSGFKSMDTCDFFVRKKPSDAEPLPGNAPSSEFASVKDLDALEERIDGRLGNIEKMLEGLM